MRLVEYFSVRLGLQPSRDWDCFRFQVPLPSDFLRMYVIEEN